MGEQLFLERFIWFDSETRHGHFPNAFKLANRFEISTKTTQRSIDYFRDCLQPSSNTCPPTKSAAPTLEISGLKGKMLPKSWCF